MEAQTGLQSGRLLASLWDFNRKDVATVLRARARLRVAAGSDPHPAPSASPAAGDTSGASLRGLSAVAARGPGHRK